MRLTKEIAIKFLPAVDAVLDYYRAIWSGELIPNERVINIGVVGSTIFEFKASRACPLCVVARTIAVHPVSDSACPGCIWQMIDMMWCSGYPSPVFYGYKDYMNDTHKNIPSAIDRLYRWKSILLEVINE